MRNKDLINLLKQGDPESYVLTYCIGGLKRITNVEFDESINNGEDSYVEIQELLGSHTSLEKMEQEFPDQELDFFSVTILE